MMVVVPLVLVAFALLERFFPAVIEALVMVGINGTLPVVCDDSKILVPFYSISIGIIIITITIHIIQPSVYFIFVFFKT